MTNQDYGYLISELTKRIEQFENEVAELKSSKSTENQDWDNATLIREWGICERSAANYRQQGLDYFKRGGRIFYTSEARKAFLERNKSN